MPGKRFPKRPIEGDHPDHPTQDTSVAQAQRQCQRRQAAAQPAPREDRDFDINLAWHEDYYPQRRARDDRSQDSRNTTAGHENAPRVPTPEADSPDHGGTEGSKSGDANSTEQQAQGDNPNNVASMDGNKGANERQDRDHDSISDLDSFLSGSCQHGRNRGLCNLCKYPPKLKLEDEELVLNGDGDE